MTRYVVFMGLDPLDDTPLYWNDLDGAVEREHASVYDTADIFLPIGSRLVAVDA